MTFTSDLANVGDQGTREADLATSQSADDSRVPFDQKVFCINTMRGRCAPGTVSLWDKRAGRCSCEQRRANLDIVPREEVSDSLPSPNTHVFFAPSMKGRCAPEPFAFREYRGVRRSSASQEAQLDIVPRGENDASRVPFDPHLYCETYTKCPPESVGLWDIRIGRCFCGSPRADIDLATREEAEASRLQSDRKTPTTVYVLTNRLLPQPLIFPTAISPPSWTAIQTTLALLRDYIKSESDLQRVCSGAKDPQAYGFELEIFRRICNPNITVPVSKSEIDMAEQMILSALFIDTILERNNNNFSGACSEAKSPGVIPSPLDDQWILFVLCHQGH